MFDQSILKDVLAKYKQDFVPMEWGREKYKWEAVRCFQDNWDVHAADFADMLSRSFAKSYLLLASANNFPASMIQEFAKEAPEEVRAMFIALFDESRDVYERIKAFKTQAAVLLKKYGDGAAQHYQHENAVTTYLWLRYPDKYYIYKFREIRDIAEKLKCDERFKKGDYANNIRNCYRLYDEICEKLKSRWRVEYKQYADRKLVAELVAVSEIGSRCTLRLFLFIFGEQRKAPAFARELKCQA